MKVLVVGAGLSGLVAATELWVALHGYVTLRASTPEFPWPHTDEILDDLITHLARIEATPPEPDGP